MDKLKYGLCVLAGFAILLFATKYVHISDNYQRALQKLAVAESEVINLKIQNAEMSKQIKLFIANSERYAEDLDKALGGCIKIKTELDKGARDEKVRDFYDVHVPDDICRVLREGTSAGKNGNKDSKASPAK